MTLVDDSMPNEHEDAEPISICRDVAVPCFPSPVNHNVLLTLALWGSHGIADSLWSGTVLVSYLSILASQLSESDGSKKSRPRNDVVGYIEACKGFVGVVAALPIGYLADHLHHGRHRVIAFGGALTILAALSHIWLLLYIGDPHDTTHAPRTSPDVQHVVVLFAGVMSMWGVSVLIVDGPVSALYADSVAAGQRSRYYVYLNSTWLLGTTVGPALSILWFRSGSDRWTLSELKNIILLGVSLQGLTSILMFLFDDRKSLPEEEGETGDDETAESSAPEEEENLVPLLAPGDASARADLESLSHRRRKIPYVLFMTEVVFALASGMTIKFFPLYFKNTVGMSPSQVQMIYVAAPFVLVATSSLAEKISRSLGRVQTIILFSSMGVVGLYAMVLFEDYLVARWYLLVPIYVLRNAMMSSGDALWESILMDNVPKKERARWISLSSIASFGWCGSAALGGVLADKYGYTYSFSITAIIQTVAIFMLFLLLPLVPRE
mmetsp:Transcript_48587/g.94973  ORF Transcript_48587/g.94973 Transcript_48587/m.94973 type:complete len:494 (-) Transcript_48587:59-1540(-)